MPVANHRGFLMPIGGAEDKTEERYILSRFVALSGGANARLAVIPSASSIPAEVAERYQSVFTSLGAASVQPIMIENRRQANEPAIVSLLDDVTGIFLTGGEQLRLVSYLGGTRLAERLHECFASGTIIAGTSAGASALSTHMIAFGRSGSFPSQRMVQLSPGLGLAPRLIIDQHFRQRDRFGRLMTAVTMNPGEIGIGVDEDTALVIDPVGNCEVIGSGSVTVVDGSELDYTDIHAVKQHGPIAALGMRVHILTNGYRYDLEAREAHRPHQPITP